MDWDDTAWGLVVAIALVALLGGAVLFVGQSKGEPVTGRVTAMGLQETQTGSYPVAVVDLGDGRSVPVQLARETRCRAGDEIALVRRGPQLTPAPRPCDAAR